MNVQRRDESRTLASLFRLRFSECCRAAVRVSQVTGLQTLPSNQQPNMSMHARSHLSWLLRFSVSITAELECRAMARDSQTGETFSITFTVLPC